MRRIDWLLVIVPLFLTWGADRITKTWAQTLTGAEFFGPIGFVLHLNSGAMLGLFSATPPVIRVVSLATGGAFLLFAFVIIQYLLPIKSLLLRAGMSFHGHFLYRSMILLAAQQSSQCRFAIWSQKMLLPPC